MKQYEKHGKSESHKEGGMESHDEGGKHHHKRAHNNIFVLPAVMLVAGILAGYLLSGVSGPSAAISQEQASEKTLSYINSALQGQASAKMVSINESNGLYIMDIDVGGTKYNSFMTKDGKLLFPSGISLDGQKNAVSAGNNNAAAIPKSDKPKVELFVMSFCPYGVQAEEYMKPVADLLGNKAEIKVRFIAQAGSDINSVQSLHGAAEANEDLRQICIMKNYPDKYWNYLSSFNGNCYPIYKNATALESCWKNSAANAGIDSAKIESCVSADSLALLKADEQAAGAYGVSGSPSLMINGATYGGARTSEGFKSAICSAFNNPPAECGQNVGTAAQAASAAPSGGCG